MQKTKIDFVLLWVDGNDKAWLAEKRKYDGSEARSSDLEAASDVRYRDYGLLQYWFRAVERFAPWVNRIFFITCGQKPDWLNESNPKLRLVDHKDYIPSDYLPTFQSNTIELNLHRLAELSEHFVLFNDDTFLLQPVKPEFFFKKGLPVIPCDLGIPYWLGYNQFSRTTINNSGILKRNLDVERLVWKNMGKFIDVRNLGLKRAARNFLSFAINKCVIPGSFGHLPQSHLKSTLDEIWHVTPNVMDITSRHRFRCDDGVNQWLACAWNMISGRFYPANEKRKGQYYMIDKNNLAQICNIIQQQSLPQICLSERGDYSELAQIFAEVSRAFEQLLPDKSSFEK